MQPRNPKDGRFIKLPQNAYKARRLAQISSAKRTERNSATPDDHKHKVLEYLERKQTRKALGLPVKDDAELEKWWKFYQDEEGITDPKQLDVDVALEIESRNTTRSALGLEPLDESDTTQ